jgi:maltose O-acetyltransferase
MLKRIELILRGLLVHIKYRSVRFLSLGEGCLYKSLSSNFSNANKISLGNNVHIGPGAMLDGAGGITVGDGSILAPEVNVFSRSHNFDDNVQALPFDNVMLVAPVHIGRFVWIGTRVIVLPGVSIGDGAVIGAGAVVSKDIPSYAVAVGNPARVVRFRDRTRFEELKRESTPFVYQKFGHAKVFRPKGQSTVSNQAKND